MYLIGSRTFLGTECAKFTGQTTGRLVQPELTLRDMVSINLFLPWLVPFFSLLMIIFQKLDCNQSTNVYSCFSESRREGLV